MSAVKQEKKEGGPCCVVGAREGQSNMGNLVGEGNSLTHPPHTTQAVRFSKDLPVVLVMADAGLRAQTEGHSTHAHDLLRPPPPAPSSTPHEKKYSGLIKRHPQDFVVREIDLAGRVADITSPATLPASWGPVIATAAAAAAAQAPDSSSTAAASSSSSFLPPCHDQQALQAVVGLNNHKALELFHRQHVVQVLEGEGGGEGQGTPAQVRLPLPSNRTARGVLHRSLKHAFPGVATLHDTTDSSLLLVTADSRNLTVARELLTHSQITLPHVLALLSYVGRGRGDPAAIAGAAAEKEGGGITLSEIMVDKAARTSVIRVVSNAFPGLQCCTKYGVRVHVAWKQSSTHHQEKKYKRKRQGAEREEEGGKGGGERGDSSSPLLLRLVLRKENLEHLEALQRLARLLGGVSLSSSLAVAGVKDKRAITYQYVSVRIARKIAALEGVRRGLLSSSPAADAAAGANDGGGDAAAAAAATTTAGAVGSGNGNSNIKMGGIQVGNLEEWRKRPLRMGESRGNAFKVVVRDVCCVCDDDEEACEEKEEKGDVGVSSAAGAAGGREGGRGVCMQEDLGARLRRLQEMGFVNYFGVQRVGGQENEGAAAAAADERGGGGEGRGGGTVGQSWELGRALLKQDYEVFTRLFLGVRQEGKKEKEAAEGNSKNRKVEGSSSSSSSNSKKHDPIQHAKSLFWDGHTPLSTILKLLPPSLARERLYLRGLQRHGRDQPARAVACLPYGVRTQWLNAHQSRLWNRMANWRVQVYGLKAVIGDLVLVVGKEEKEGGKEGGEVGGDGGEQEGKQEGEQEKRPVVRRLTAEDLEEEGMGEALLEKVLMPLMGYDVELPGNEEMQRECRRVMEEEGVWELLRTKQDATAGKDSGKVVGNLKGAYRPLLVKPRELAWTFLARRDGAAAASVGSAVVVTEEKEKEKEIMDVELTFQLPPGSFATVLIREFLG